MPSRERSGRGGRPRRLDKKTVAILVRALDDYVERTEHPFFAEFCSSDPVAKEYLMHKDDLGGYKEFAQVSKKLLMKQEAYLVKQSLNGAHPTMPIFLLKQRWMGYSDRMEQDITTGGERISFANAVPRPKK